MVRLSSVARSPEVVLMSPRFSLRDPAAFCEGVVSLWAAARRFRGWGSVANWLREAVKQGMPRRSAS